MMLPFEENGSPGVRVVRQPRRKRAAFVAVAGGEIELRVPAAVPDSLIRRLLDDNRRLIDELRRRTAAVPAKKNFIEGENFLYLGRNYPLRFSSRLLTFDDAFIIPRAADPAEALETLYRRLAAACLPGRCREIAAASGLVPAAIRINAARTRWGSCNRDGGFNLNWRLVQLPETLIDYVICHETCHRFVFNHSPAFWARLRLMMPDFEARRRMLRRIERSGELW